MDEIIQRFDRLEAAIKNIDERLTDLAQAMLNKAQFELEQAQKEVKQFDDKKEAIRARYVLIDSLHIRVERIEERLASLAAALTEG